MYLKVETELVPKRPRGRPRKYDNWFEFNYEYQKYELRNQNTNDSTDKKRKTIEC